MAKYEVVLYETIRYTVIVDADNTEDARNKVSIMDTDELERIRDNEFYGLDVMDTRKVDDGTV
jgi:hypothetical protein